ncbi:trypsin [Marinomonas mediterranea]|uniref:VanZ family protein n=1 Tax=Marinomonas mediterranea TaxID=119864 RepID=UPI00234A9111|nr:VanZ family protein [Marinomonas mediterranea]WCN13996.1 trypsin [Marinomonas mediterranea]
MYKLIALGAALFFTFIVWVIYLANTGGNSIFFDFVRSIPYGDKFGHAGLFGFLAILLTSGLKFRSLRIRNFKIYYGLIWVLLFVFLEEFSQIFIPLRTFDFVDLAADMVGILVATVICFVASKHLIKSSSGAV